MAVTDEIYTVGPGKDYATITAAEGVADDNSDLTDGGVGDGRRIIFECYDADYTVTSNVSFINYTTTPTNYLWVKGMNPVGWSSGGHRINASTPNQIFNIRQDYTVVTDIYAELTLYSAANTLRITPPAGGTAQGCRIERCILVSRQSGASDTYAMRNTAAGGDGTTIRNSILAYGYFGLSLLVDDVTIENCAFLGEQRALHVVDPVDSLTIKNCIAYGGAISDFSMDATNTNETFSNNAAEAANCLNFTPDLDLTSDPYSGVTDFLIDDTNVLAGEGVNLYGTFTDDLAGNTRQSTGAWDIGPYLAETTSVQLSPDGVGQLQTVDVPTLTQANALSPDAIESLQTIAQVALTQAHNIAPDALQIVHTVEGTAVAVSFSVSPAPVDHLQSVEVTALTQQHSLGVIDLMHLQEIAETTLTASGPTPIPVLSNVAATLTTSTATTPAVEVNY